MTIPKMVKIKQLFNDKKIDNIENELKNELEKLLLKVNNGSRIAIAVGSRGIANIKKIVETTVDFIKNKEASPFIIPAMGSHGGATAEGQAKILADYGITEGKIGCPILSSMEVVELPQEGIINKVYVDKYAYKADGIIIINRIKPHTSFHGTYESGLMKMLAIGLGKHKGAIEIHKYGVEGLQNYIYPTAKQIIKHTGIIGGLAIVENAYDETMIIKALSPEEFENEEPELLKISKVNMSSLPVNEIDILIIDELGKNISGVGIDPNIIGRIRIEGVKEPDNPKIRRVIVSDITKESNGNALGMGLADFITEKFKNKIDYKPTYENALTSTFIERVKTPIIMPDEKEAFLHAVRTLGSIDVDKLRIVRIKNTLRLDEVYVSQEIYRQIKTAPNINMLKKDNDLFTINGELTNF